MKKAWRAACLIAAVATIQAVGAETADPDPARFAELALRKLEVWLAQWLQSPLFAGVMQKREFWYEPGDREYDLSAVTDDVK